MSIRLALFPMLLLGLWSCGEDEDDPPPVAPGPGATVLRPSGELQPWDLSAIVSIDSVRSQPGGMPVYLRTEFANGQLADLEMTFVQVVDDFLPPMPIIMVEASDPVLIQLGGIAQGMSGSPLFSEKGTWGAIAYAFTNQDGPPYYAFATPIEWVIGERGAPSAKPGAASAGIVPLEIPLAVTGAPGPAPWAGSVPAALTQERQESFEAGRPLAVALILGEVTAAGVGTISYVSGSRVYGFGHSMDGAGPVELPIIEARIIGEVSHLAAPFKFATLNPTVRGTLTEDRRPAVRGVLGEAPDLVTVRSFYDLGGRTVELEHQAPPSRAVEVVTLAVFRPLVSRVDNDPDHALRVTAEVSFDETDSTMSRSRLYAASEGRIYSLVGLAERDLGTALGELTSRERDLVGLQVQEAEVRVEVIPNRYAKVVEVAADSVIAAGEDLAVTVSLRVGAQMREIEMALRLPEDLPPGGYRLGVGSEWSLGEAGYSGGDFGGELDWPLDLEGGEETLEEVFARVNEPDGNVVLKAQLTPGDPFGFDAAGLDPQPEGAGPGGAPAPVTSRQEVDLYLAGTASMEVEVAGE